MNHLYDKRRLIISPMADHDIFQILYWNKAHVIVI